MSDMDKRDDPEFFRLLAGSYRRLLGRDLTPAGLDAREAARWLYDAAPFVVLAHDAAADPVFVYGNRAAQRRFGYSWEELTRMPSRLSAETPERAERQRFLEEVTRAGFVADYRGIRIAKNGQRFWIEGATIWQLIDEQGVRHGQAALVPRTADIAS
ncbi:MAG TPA: MEKHLA domain-containing protein [Stellaceae bacterium]|jgi:PAS domain S-box-containing protein|nr:MEKHLA domain-containing protein [Stellaceae bacterium]